MRAKRYHQWCKKNAKRRKEAGLKPHRYTIRLENSFRLKRTRHCDIKVYSGDRFLGILGYLPSIWENNLEN